MADYFNYTAAINDAFGAIERLGALKLNKAREDAAIARADATAATNRNFQATQAQLDREARLRMNAEDNAAADRRTTAAEKAADARMTAAEKKADDLVKAEERRLKAAAKTIGSVQAELDALQAERDQLATQMQQELAQQTEKEIRQQFTAGLTPKQRKALAALGGDVERLIAAAPESDALALQQQLEMARSKAEERLKLFTPPSQAKFALNQTKILKQDTLLNDLKRRNPGYIDYVEVAQPEAATAPAADAGFGAVAEEARAALKAQAPAAQPAAPAFPMRRIAPEEAAQMVSPAAAPAQSQEAIRYLAPPPEPTPQDQQRFERVFDRIDRQQPVQQAPRTTAQLPAFNPVDFARNQFGIDVADMTPDDQQGMLQLALRDGLTQADVASVIDRVKQGDPSALQVVRQYQERWNATRGARPRAGVDLGMVGLG
jgi:hypothetical protein